MVLLSIHYSENLNGFPDPIMQIRISARTALSFWQAEIATKRALD
jgi:hypothetical protein